MIELCDVNSRFARSIDAAIMIWYLVNVGIRRLCRKNVTVSNMQVNDIAGVHMLRQL